MDGGLTVYVVDLMVNLGEFVVPEWVNFCSSTQ